MAKAIVVGCACVVFSELTPEEIKRCKLYRPDLLTLEGESFSVDIDVGPGHLCEEDALFSTTSSSEGKATITILLDPEKENKMELVQEQLCASLMKLEQVEQQVLSSRDQLAEEEKRVQAMITML